MIHIHNKFAQWIMILSIEIPFDNIKKAFLSRFYNIFVIVFLHNKFIFNSTNKVYKFNDFCLNMNKMDDNSKKIFLSYFMCMVHNTTNTLRGIC